MTKKPYYNRTGTCDVCRENGIETKLVPGVARREYNKEGNWTGRWVCKNCRNNQYYYDCYKYDPNSGNNTRKLIANIRTNNQDPNSVQAIGDRFQELTCRWRSTVSSVSVKDMNKKLDNYTTSIDHSWDSELGILQTRGRNYSSYDQLWGFSSFEREWNKNFDCMICYCASKDGKTIERIYIFPKSEIVKRISINIYSNPSKGFLWYEQYRITDRKIIDRVNNIWEEIINRK